MQQDEDSMEASITSLLSSIQASDNRLVDAEREVAVLKQDLALVQQEAAQATECARLATAAAEIIAARIEVPHERERLSTAPSSPLLVGRFSLQSQEERERDTSISLGNGLPVDQIASGEFPSPTETKFHTLSGSRPSFSSSVAVTSSPTPPLVACGQDGGGSATLPNEQPDEYVRAESRERLPSRSSEVNHFCAEARELLEAVQNALKDLGKQSELTKEAVRKLEAQADSWKNEVKSVRELRRGTGEHLEQLRQRATVAQTQLEAALQRCQLSQPSRWAKSVAKEAKRGPDTSVTSRTTGPLDGGPSLLAASMSSLDEGKNAGGEEHKDRLSRIEARIERLANDIKSVSRHQLESQDVAVSGFDRLESALEQVRFRADAAYTSLFGGASASQEAARAPSSESRDRKGSLEASAYRGAAVSSVEESSFDWGARSSATQAPLTRHGSTGQQQLRPSPPASYVSAPRSASSVGTTPRTSPTTSPLLGHRAVRPQQSHFSTARVSGDLSSRLASSTPRALGRGVAKPGGPGAHNLYAPPPQASSMANHSFRGR